MNLLLQWFLNTVNRDILSLEIYGNSESLPRIDKSSGRMENLERYMRLSFLLGGNVKF